MTSSTSTSKFERARLHYLRLPFKVSNSHSERFFAKSISIAISQSLTPQDQMKAILSTVSDAFADCIAGDTDAEILSTFITSWTSCFVILPGCLSISSRETYLKALESQLTSLRDREIERLEVVEDADDALAWDDVTEVDARVFRSISRSIGAMLKADGQSFPIEPFMPFLGLLNGASAPPTHFALRLVYDTILSMGDRSSALVQPYLQTILKLLGDSGTLSLSLPHD